MEHFYRDVKGLGNVAVSRHAQARILSEGISEDIFFAVLLHPVRPDQPDGQDILWREGKGIRIVIHTDPVPYTGAKLVTTVYKIQAQANAKRHR